MKKTLLTGIAALFLATGVAHAQREPYSFFGPRGDTGYPPGYTGRLTMNPVYCAKIPAAVRADARGCAPIKQPRKKGTR
jgi:hypothetical protein